MDLKMKTKLKKKRFRVKDNFLKEQQKQRVIRL